MFALQPMFPEAAKAIARWSYPPPYELYNHPPEKRGAIVEGLLEPDNAYEVLQDDGLGLVGFCCFGPDARVAGCPYPEGTLDVGIGLRPDLTGQGLGQRLAEVVILRAADLAPTLPLRVTVAAFNARARRVWEKQSFHIDAHFQRPSDGTHFVRMCQRPGPT